MTDCLRRLFDCENKEGKEKMEKEYVKLLRFVDMILYIENPKDATHKKNLTL